MSARKGDETPIIPSSGNVFRDLGIQLSAEDEIRIEIAKEITRVINARGYTQTQVAKIFGTDQAKVSNIVRGKLSGLSVERLLKYLLSLGVNVDVHLSEVSASADDTPSEGRVTFHAPVAASG